MQINLKLDQIRKIVGASCSLDDSFLIENITSLENAKENDLAVLIDRGSESVFDQVSLDKVKNSKAGLILASKEICSEKNYLVVKNPLAAFNSIVNFLENKDNKFNIDSTATVSAKAEIKENVKIGAGSVVCDGSKIDKFSIICEQVFIGKNVTIGCNVKLYPGVKVLDGCKIGNNSIIHSGTIIGSDGFGYSATKMGMQKVPQIGIVEIGSNVEIGANSSIDRATFEKTTIGDGVKIDNQVHIAHNVKVGAHTAILAQTGIAGGVVIGMGCQIGGQVAIKDHVTIGNGVKIVSKSGIMKNLKDKEVVAGVPAIPFGQWKRVMVIVSRLPELLKKLSFAKQKKSFWQRLFKI